MEETLFNPNTLSCTDSVPSLLGVFDPSIAPSLLYYAYIPIVIVSLVFGLIIFLRDKKSILSRLFAGITVTFSLWVLNIIVQWIATPNSIIYFAWQLTAILEILIFLLAIYFVDVFISHKDISANKKILLGVIYLSALVLTPTVLNVSSYDLTFCEGTIGPLWYAIYAFEVTSLLWIASIGFNYYKEHKNSTNGLNFSRQNKLVTIGTIVFLFLFSGSNIYGEITQNYAVNLIGPIGMVVFLGLIAYLLSKYKSFGSTKIIGVQMLVYALWVLVFSLVFINSIDLIHIVVGITFILLIILGVGLIRSVKKEIEQKERLERLTFQLSDANEKLKDLDKSKTEFLSLASHQLRSPLTAIKGYSSMLLDGSYGEIQEKNKMPIDRIFQSANNLTLIVEDLLSVTKIEQGGMQYEFTGIDLAKVAKTLVEEQSVNAKKRGLELVFDNKIGTAIVMADATKIRQVLLNFVDNAIKYTPKGSVSVTVESIDGNKVRFAVKDSGVGMSEETKHNLFEKFKRGEEGSRIDSGGSGLGLYLAKEIVGAHAGEIHVESDGVGKGSTFIVDLPLKNRESKVE